MRVLPVAAEKTLKSDPRDVLPRSPRSWVCSLLLLEVLSIVASLPWVDLDDAAPSVLGDVSPPPRAC